LGNKDKRITELETQLKFALEENERLRAEIIKLKDKIDSLNKTSKNSHKPPSSDIVDSPKTGDIQNQEQKKGAKFGHKQHLRKPFDKIEVHETFVIDLKTCPVCEGKLQASNESPEVHQRIELVEKPFIVTEYIRPWYWCDYCKCFHIAKLPQEVEKSGFFGPKLIAFTAYLKGRCHMSYKTIKDFFADTFKLNVSTGFLAKQVHKASEAIAIPYNELKSHLPEEKHLHIDETGGKENGDKRWNWCFRAEKFTVFHINKSRGSEVLEKILGKDFGGIISCDFWGAYRKFSGLSLAVLQFCWAHLIREVKFFAGSGRKEVSSYGERMLVAIKMMFNTIHQRDLISEREWILRMEKHREMIMWESWEDIPDDSDVENIAERLWEWQEEYFCFIYHKIPPTNNLGEQSIRRIVIDRKITQGTRSDWGNHWMERFWSVLSTCEQQGKNVMVFLNTCIESYLHGHAPPSLLNN